MAAALSVISELKEDETGSDLHHHRAVRWSASNRPGKDNMDSMMRFDAMIIHNMGAQQAYDYIIRNPRSPTALAL